MQLEHDAAEKSKERTAVLRREVYLRAAEELTRANAVLASLPQADLAKVNAADALQGFFAAAAKLQLVAEPHTALLVNKLVATYGELLLRIMKRLIPLQKARIDITISDNLYNDAHAQVNRVLAEMAKFNETAESNSEVFNALQQSFDHYQAQADNHAAQRNASWGEFNQLNIEFCRQLLTELRNVGEQQVTVLIEIRRDLGLTAELGAFREQMEAQWNRMAAELDALILALQDA